MANNHKEKREFLKFIFYFTLIASITAAAAAGSTATTMVFAQSDKSSSSLNNGGSVNGNSGSGTNIPPPAGFCGSEPITRSNTCSKPPTTPTCDTIDNSVHVYKAPRYWTFDWYIAKGQGLVLRDIHIIIPELKIYQPLFHSISIPHLNIESKIVRFCDDPKNTKFDSIPKVIKGNGIDHLIWSFTKDFQDSDLKGRLTINYDIVVRWNPTHNCEASNNVCLRFVPLMSFNWQDESIHRSHPKLDSVAANYKLDYGMGVGLALTKDADRLLPFFNENYGRQNIVTKETKFTAVLNGKAADSFDNIHNAHLAQTVKIPGCRHSLFDCIHIHWRWSGITFNSVDPMVEPSDDKPISEGLRGTPYLVDGQTIQIVIVNYKSEVDDPDHPWELVKEEGKEIATATDYAVVSANNPIVWYIAVVENTNGSDTKFFRHGFFVLDTRE